MNIIKRILVLFFLLLFIYFLSWLIFGKNLLYEQSARYLLNKRILSFHESNKFYIVTKYYGDNVEYKYKLKISNKDIININTKEEEDFLWMQEKEKIDIADYSNCFLEIDVIKYTLLYTIIDSRYIPNDVNNDQIVFIWVFWKWIKIY
jgi:hypothetical protein